MDSIFRLDRDETAAGRNPGRAISDPAFLEEARSKIARLCIERHLPGASGMTPEELRVRVSSTIDRYGVEHLSIDGHEVLTFDPRSFAFLLEVAPQIQNY